MKQHWNTTHRQRFHQASKEWDQETEFPVVPQGPYTTNSRGGFSSRTSEDGTSNFQTSTSRTKNLFRGSYRHGGNRMSQPWGSHDKSEKRETRTPHSENEENARRSCRADNNSWRGASQRGHASRDSTSWHQQRGKEDETSSRIRTSARGSFHSKQGDIKQTDTSEGGNSTSGHEGVKEDGPELKRLTPEKTESSASGQGENEVNRPSEAGDYQVRLQRQAALAHGNDDEGWPHIVGSCLDMCPAEEREKRARLRDLAVFERLDGDHSRTSKELAVKKFCRTFSGKDLKKSDIRPLLVLCQTMQHLLSILDLGEYPFEVVHDFLFDRTRAIRQELSMQRIINEMAVSIYENIVRFHIISEHQLRQQRASGKVFDSHLNFQQLSKALLSLLNLYVVLSDKNHLSNEAEFSCYYVLLNLSQSQQLSLWFQSASPALLETADVQFSRSVLKCYQQRNYIGFFRLTAKATYLQACLMELHFNEVRATALQIINSSSYKLHPYPLCELGEMLLMEVEDMEEFCSLHGLAVGTNASNELQLLSKQAEFTPPKQGLRHYPCQVIEHKRPAKLQELFSTNLTMFGG